jgi:hypothetical protein
MGYSKINEAEVPNVTNRPIIAPNNSNPEPGPMYAKNDPDPIAFATSETIFKCMAKPPIIHPKIYDPLCTILKMSGG